MLRVIWPPHPDLSIAKKGDRWVIKGGSVAGTAETFKSKKKAKRYLRRVCSTSSK